MASKSLKVVIILINILFLALGAVLIGIGAWELVDREGVIEHTRMEFEGLYTDMADPGLVQPAAILAIVEGGSMIVLAILAFVGVKKESKCYLALYCGFLIVLILLLITIVVLTAVNKELFDDNMRSNLKDAIANEYDGILSSTNRFTRAFDAAQIEFECCGVDNYTEFNSDLTTIWVDKGDLQVPKACCIIDKDLYFNNDQFRPVVMECARRTFTNETNIAKACYDSLRDWMIEKSLVILGVAVGVAIIQVLALLFAFCFIRSIGKLYG